MEYLTREELVRLFKVARDHNKLHHVAMLVGLLHGLRVSEMLAIRGGDICDGRLSIKRLKKSRATLHALWIDSDLGNPVEGERDSGLKPNTIPL